MAGNWIILVSVFCVSWGASYPSEEYLTLQPTDMDAEPGSPTPRTPPTQQVQAINGDPAVVARTTYPTDSIQSFVEQESNTNTPETVEVDLASPSEENVDTSTVTTTDQAESTDISILAKQTQPSRNTLGTVHNGTDPTNRITGVDGTTINSHALDWTTLPSVEGSQTSTTEVTQRTYEQKLSTMAEDIPTTFEIDPVNHSEHIPTMATDDSAVITSSGTSEILTVSPISASTVDNANITPDSSEISTAHYPTTTIGYVLNDLATTAEVDDESTIPSVDDVHSSLISASPTMVGPDIMETNQSTTTKVVSTESIPVELLSITSSDFRATTDTLTTSHRPNNQTLLTLCNNDNPCADDYVCVLENKECFCVSNLNTFPNVHLCESPTDHDVIIPSNGSVSVNPTVGNSTSDLDQARHREFSHAFFTKKLSELSTRQKSHNIITVSFSPAMEVIEWFQSYDWKYRKYVSTALTTCMHHTMVNDSMFTPSDIVYVSPSPLRDGLGINVSFLVHTHWDNSFVRNTIVIGCLTEGREDCEAQFQLTVKSVEGSFPKRLLRDCNVRVAGLSANAVKLLFIGAVISLTVSFLSLLVFTIKCRQGRGRFEPRSGLYRHPRVLTRSPGDGHNLATDEQCQQDEGRRKGDSGTWVVPLEEVEAMERDTKPENEQDTKI